MIYNDLNLWKWTDGICTTHRMTVRRGLTKSPRGVEPQGLSRKTLYIYYRSVHLNYQALHTITFVSSEKEDIPCLILLPQQVWRPKSKVHSLCMLYLCYIYLKESPSGQSPSSLPWALDFPKTYYSGKTFT